MSLFITVVSILCLTPAGLPSERPRASPIETAQLLRSLRDASFVLRESRLSADEEREAVERLASTSPARDVYRQFLDRWITADVLIRFVEGYAQVSETLPAASRFFQVGSLERFRDERHNVWIYYLARTPENRTATPPCSFEESVYVRPWWSRDPVRICTDSYRPEPLLKAVTYCLGLNDPKVPEARREGCGCGPLLLSCLPPAEVAPELGEQFERAVPGEIIGTLSALALNDRSIAEAYTTSKTWQTGLTEFLYLRRKVLSFLVSKSSYSDRVRIEAEQMLDGVDMTMPARWVEREAPYQGAGVFAFSPYFQSAIPTFRGGANILLKNALCTSFASVHVDRDTLLAADTTRPTRVEAPFVGQNPARTSMQTLVGCKNCHAPLDNVASFFLPVAQPGYGGILTGQPSEGALYVNGPKDFRGSAQGIAGLGRLLTTQPEFDLCVVERTLTYFFNQPNRLGNRSLVKDLAERFRKNGRRARWLVRAVLESPLYFHSGSDDLIEASAARDAR